MEYFEALRRLLKAEKEEDRRAFGELMQGRSVADRREAGATWYPVAIRETELGRGDYLSVALERTTHTELTHIFRTGMTAVLFSNHDPQADRIEGTVARITGNRLLLALRTDELPDWSRSGKLGIDAVFDENSYAEMEGALKRAEEKAESKEEGRLIRVLTGTQEPQFGITEPVSVTGLNESQEAAVAKICAATDLAIVHGPPGTGKTTTVVQAIKALYRQHPEQILVTAPSNAAVDLLTERLAAAGLSVVRIGNPARVNDRQLSFTLDAQLAAHPTARDIRRLKKQAAEYRDLAQKYKRSFGPAEQEQRKALFKEARAVREEAERTEEYATQFILDKAQVLTATLVGAAHYSIRQRRYGTVVIDEAAQALEPACWIPILKGRKLVLAGDHQQLPPTIKSPEARPLSVTLMEKGVQLYPQAVVLLEEQYRMHKQIMGFSSQEFYEGRLHAAPAVAERLLLPEDTAFQFIDTAGCGYEEVREGSRLSNPEEAAFLITQLVRYVTVLQAVHRPEAFPTFAVIAPYRHQVEVLQEQVQAHPALQAVLPSITINTIDSFQGGERDAVFISLSRSNSDSGVGFLSELRRINVALTRARSKLVVVGDSATLSSVTFYADLITYAQETGGYVSAWEVMEG